RTCDSLVVPRPPPPPLFPYTTLFRSGRGHDPGLAEAAGLGQDRRQRPAEGDDGGVRHQLRLEVRRRAAERLRRPGVRRDDGGGRDRKSTRLNSSHVKISYAVFCLKKK